MKKLTLNLVILLSIILVSCSDDSPTQSPGVFEIVKFNPLSESAGGEVAIYCINFPKNVTAPEVYFSVSKQADIKSITNVKDTTILTCYVPAEAITGKITVKANTVTAVSKTDFTVLIPIGDFFPLTNGSYWISNIFELDSNNQRITEYHITDSLTITGEIEKLGVTATIFRDYQNSGTGYIDMGEQLYYTNNSRIYAHTDAINSLLNVNIAGFELPFDIEEQWLLLADPYQNSWEIYQKTFTNDSVKYGTFWVYFSGELTINGSFIADESVTAAGESVMAKKYLTQLSFAGSVKLFGQDIPINITRNLYSWYSINIGRVKIKMETLKINVPEISPDTQVLKGYDYDLINYKIAQ